MITTKYLEYFIKYMVPVQDFLCYSEYFLNSLLLTIIVINHSMNNLSLAKINLVIPLKIHLFLFPYFAINKFDLVISFRLAYYFAFL